MRNCNDTAYMLQRFQKEDLLKRILCPKKIDPKFWDLTHALWVKFLGLNKIILGLIIIYGDNTWID